MRNIFTLQKDYTLLRGCRQLVLPLDIEYLIPSDDQVRLLSQFVDSMWLGGLYWTYHRMEKENQATPRQLLKILIYAYMNHMYSTRRMEEACRRDINFMWLLEGKKVPDHTTLSRFRSLHFAPCAEEVMGEVTEFLYRCGELSGESIFIDGTKIEAFANKYTFVWKKSVTKNLEKLLIKLAAFVESCEALYGIKVVYGNQVQMRHVKKLRKKLYAVKEAEGIEFVHGTGKRKSILQKSIEALEGYLEKFKEYTKKLHLCGERNSYSKTDPDATFMRMKEDAMGNGQLKAGYNLQHGVDSEYVVWLSIGPEPTDTTTLIPFLESFEERLGWLYSYKKIVADAGYESEENYGYLDEKGKISFIRPSNYEASKKKSYKNDIGRVEHMSYDAEKDVYICHEGRELPVVGIKSQKTKTGYKREITIYACEDCSGCPRKKECVRGSHSKKPIEERNKTLYISKRFIRYRKEDEERIISDEGCRLRMNRSIQAEGSFGDLKQDRGFRRFMCRGKENVKAEAVLLAIAYNIEKLHHKIQGERTGTHLFALKKRA